ncbi:hypothetical protein PVAP13_9KG193985 [Panicum virgatum]|uniref:Uncharacterized protein n=1 Tax=Panicum virgatum TaxID=38727 RepID=A0A8T0NKD8_PANVG|nr:hypothetical protein PVAP13_9KG193985 [Panicum virgatum]
MHHEQPWRGEERKGAWRPRRRKASPPAMKGGCRGRRRGRRALATPGIGARRVGRGRRRWRRVLRLPLQRRNAPGHGTRSPSSPRPSPSSYPDFQRRLPAADALRTGQAPRRSPATSPGRRWRRRRCVPGRATTARPRHAPAARLRLLRAAAAGSELLIRMRPAHCGSLRRAARR